MLRHRRACAARISAFCFLLSACLACHRETRALAPSAQDAARPRPIRVSGLAEWIYGSSPAQIYESIAEGRPNGMPSWGGQIQEYQIWQLVTYVRSVGGFEGKVATPSRAEGMQAKRAEEPKP